MKIILETVANDKMRYDTLGDWFYDEDGALRIQVLESLPPDVAPDTHWIIALHELVEAKLCELAGVTQKQVDDFDMAFKGEGEPGDAPDSPYRVQHRQACLIEFQVAAMCGIYDYGTME